MIAAALLACTLSATDAAYLQQALDGWTTITRDLLRLPVEELPWMVVYDRNCAYHLAADPATRLGREGRVLEDVRLEYHGRPVTTRAIALRDEVALPNGARLPVSGIAFTSVYGGEGSEKPFFATALPDVWARDPKYASHREDWPSFVLEVLSHELVHTRQIVAIMRQLNELNRRFPLLPDTVDDDWLQKTFEPRPGVAPTVRAEIALLHQAAAEPDLERARQLARTALELMRARRATYYGADTSAYSALEDVFLNMEGVACWSAFQLSRKAAHPAVADVRSLDAFRGNRRFWSQEAGLALFLTLDRFVPNWRTQVFPPELASPVDLLDQALAAVLVRP